MLTPKNTPSIPMSDFKAQSFVDQIAKEIARSERRLRAKAAMHVRAAMRKNISSRSTSAPHGFPGLETGNLRKGIKNKNMAERSIIGSTSPHAHLLEYGHSIVDGTGKVIGKVEKRPFVIPTMMQEANAVKAILSEKWVK